MDSFISGLEQDLSRGLNIAGFRALLAVQDNVISTGVFLEDYREDIKEVVINGSLNGEELGIASDSSISDWVDRINIESKKINLIIDYKINSLEVSHSSPWEVNVGMNITFFIKDTNNVASWTTEDVINASVSILGFEDPFYIVNTFAKDTRIISKTNTSVWGIDKLKDHLNQKTYKAYTGAPSFLMRLEGDTSSSQYGIETLVDTNKLSELEIPVKSASSVDYIYWSDAPTQNYKIDEITDEFMPGFKLDSDHVNEFNVGNYTY